MSLDYKRLQAHHNRDRVNLLTDVGLIVTDVEDTLGRSEAAKWKKNNFKDMHRRYFEQSKQLAQNEAIARKYASLGKNRLLELIRLLKATDKTIEELLKDYPFPDTVKDEKGFLFTKHIDSIINLFRLRAADIEFATIDDAKRIAAFRTKAIEVNRAVQIKEKLDELGSGVEQQKEIFEEYLKNSLHFPQDSDSQNTVAPPDINQILANVIKYYDPDKFEDDNWVAHQKEIVDEDIIVNAYRIIVLIAGKLEIKIPTI